MGHPVALDKGGLNWIFDISHCLAFSWKICNLDIQRDQEGFVILSNQIRTQTKFNLIFLFSELLIFDKFFFL